MHPRFWNVDNTIPPPPPYSYTCSTIQDGAVALGRASMNGHQEVVDVLLRAGANPDVQEKVRAWCTVLIVEGGTCMSCRTS